MEEQYDFISVGDTVTDAFIRLKEASVHCRVNHEECEICMRFGDKIPYQEAFVIPAVGNSANAAVSAARLGLKSALVANIGADYYGKEAIEALQKEKVGTDFITVHKDIPTNYHYVLWYNDDRTILVKHENYPYKLPEIGTPKWLYLSSLGDNTELFHDEISNYLESHPTVQLVFQPGTFQMKMGHERLSRLYKHSKLFFCNKEEAERILDLKEADIQHLLRGMRALGPDIVVITDGPDGAYSYDGNEMWFTNRYPDPKPPYERTGAGDAFASTFTVAIAHGLDIREALRWGAANSMSVVQDVGARAGLLGREAIEKLLAEVSPAFEQKKIG
jgi:ribokinase